MALPTSGPIDNREDRDDDDVPDDQRDGGERAAQDSAQDSAQATRNGLQDSGFERARRRVRDFLPGGATDPNEAPGAPSPDGTGGDDSFQSAKDETRKAVASGNGSANASSGAPAGPGADDPFQNVKDETRKDVARGEMPSADPPTSGPGPDEPEPPVDWGPGTPAPKDRGPGLPDAPKDRGPGVPDAPQHFDRGGLEHSPDASIARQSRELEEEFLAKNPDFDAGDVRIVRTDDGGIRTQVSKRAELGVAMDSIAEQFDDEYQDVDLDYGDVDVFRTDDDGFSGTLSERGKKKLLAAGFEEDHQGVDLDVSDVEVTETGDDGKFSGELTESGVSKVEAATEERIDTGLTGFGFEGTEATGYRAPDAAGVETVQDKRHDVAKTGIGIEGVDTGQETAPTSGEGTFREQQVEEGLRGIGFEGTKEEGLRAPDAAGEATFREQNQPGKATPGGAVVPGSGIIDNPAPGLEVREPGTVGQVERAGDADLSRITDAVGLTESGPGDPVEGALDDALGGVSDFGDEVGLFVAGLSRNPTSAEAAELDQPGPALDFDDTFEAFEEGGVSGLVNYVQDQGQQKIDAPGKGGEFAYGVGRGPVDVVGGGVLGLTKASLEVGEAAGFVTKQTLQGQGDEALETVTDVGIETGAQIVQGVEDKPYTTAGQVVGSLGASVAVFKAASAVGPRAGLAARAAIQPGEELIGHGGNALVRRTVGKGAAERLFPNNEPLIFSEEAAIRGARGARSKLSRSIRRTKERLAAERGLPATPHQKTLVERFRPGGATGELTIETNVDVDEFTPVESTAVGVTSEPLGSGGSGPILDADTVSKGAGSPGSTPTKADTTLPETETGADDLPLFDDISEAGGVRPFIRGEDLPPRISKIETGGFLRDERASGQLLGGQRRGLETDPGELTEFTDYDIFEDTLTSRQDAFGDYEGRYDPLGRSKTELSSPEARRRAAEKSEVSVDGGKLFGTRVELTAGISEDLDDVTGLTQFDALDTPATGVGVDQTPGVDVRMREGLDQDFDMELGLDTDLGLEVEPGSVESRKFRPRLDLELEQEAEAETENESETEVEMNLKQFDPSKPAKKRKKSVGGKSISSLFENPSISPGEIASGEFEAVGDDMDFVEDLDF